jgi:hypothetical protein
MKTYDGIAEWYDQWIGGRDAPDIDNSLEASALNAGVRHSIRAVPLVRSLVV